MTYLPLFGLIRYFAPVGYAQPVEHLAQLGRRRGVHQSLVVFEPHGFHHALRSEPVDEAGGAFGRAGITVLQVVQVSSIIALHMQCTRLP